PKIPRRVSGYNLDELLPERGFNVAHALVGTESTCVTILQAELTLVDNPKARSLLVLGYPDVYSAGDHVPDLLAFKPIGLEGVDGELINERKKGCIQPEHGRRLPDGNGGLLVECGGARRAEREGKVRAAMDGLTLSPNPPAMKIFSDPKDEQRIWKV